jgi:TPR repeat protein
LRRSARALGNFASSKKYTAARNHERESPSNRTSGPLAGASHEPSDHDRRRERRRCGVTGADRAEDAREFIAEAGEPGPKSYADAYERAREFQKEGRPADAQLLYFYAARGGNAAAEFELAAMNDPNHHASATNPFQAYKWYSAALEHGSREAQSRLDALHDWTEKAAAEGNSEAERLLLQWP